MDDDWEPGEDAHELVKELYDIWDNLSQRSMLEPGTMRSNTRRGTRPFQPWHRRPEYACTNRENSTGLYLPVKSTHCQRHEALPEEFRKLSKLLADKYFCNFSLFQSLPDSWAIDQMFPSCPFSGWMKDPTARLPCRI